MCFHCTAPSAGPSVVFTGDALFVGGCGRNFGDDWKQMHASLQLLGQLPIDTQVYCGHEYTQRNLEFLIGVGMAHLRTSKGHATLQTRAMSSCGPSWHGHVHSVPVVYPPFHPPLRYVHAMRDCAHHHVYACNVGGAVVQRVFAVWAARSAGAGG